MTRLQWLLKESKRKTNKCILWPFSCGSSGYGQLLIDGKYIMPHRMVCLIYRGDPPKNAHAAHSCGNRKCINPRHLSWKTPSENQMDRPSQGRPFTGRKKKFTSEEIRYIRQSMLTNVTLATAYGCTESNIRHIRNRATYRHVT